MMSGIKPEKKGSQFLQALLTRVRSALGAFDPHCMLLMLAGAAALFAVCCTVCISGRYSLEVGDISDRNIAATKDVEDRIATREQRSRAELAVGPSYHRDDGISREVMTALEETLAQLELVQEYGKSLRESRDMPANASATFTAEEKKQGRSLVTRLNISDQQAQVLMRTDDAEFDTMRSSVSSMLAEALENSISQEQRTQTINAIVDKCYEDNSNELVIRIIRPLLTATIQANMIVDEAATRETRDAADRVRAGTIVDPPAPAGALCAA